MTLGSKLRRNKWGNTADNRKHFANIKVKGTLNLPVQKYVALFEIHFVKIWGGPNKLLSKVLQGNILS